jgi:ABC-type transport system involved in multi-copper enzyme maturation permease subunit
VAFTSVFEAAYAAVPLGTVGAVVFGVVVMSSEYTANSADAGSGRQITATLAASPHRVGLLVAKALTVVLLVAVTAAASIPACVGVAHLIIGDSATEVIGVGDALVRSLGATLYWTLTGLIAFAITVLTRSGIIPLVVLIANSSLVSVSLLLTNLTPLAYWLPDLAGRKLFIGMPTVAGGPGVETGAWVMAAWTLGLLAIAGAVFSRRDA